MKKLLVLTSAFVLMLVSGCASIMHGTSQEVSISSNPTGATVTSSGRHLGTTPLVADLRRNATHILQVNLDGYQPYEIALSRGVSGWVWGNIVFGGIIGLVVDFSTGGVYKLTPEQVQADLRPDTASLTNEALILHVVLEPKPEWQQIGQLALVD